MSVVWVMSCLECRRHVPAPIRHQVNAFLKQRHEKHIAGFLIAIQRVAITRISSRVVKGNMITGTDPIDER
jgi:hypothetical protein